MPDIDIIKLVKDFGLPIVALWYLFRLYNTEVNKNAVREERCIKVIEENTISNTQLIIAMQNVSSIIRTETEVRQQLLSKLVDRALTEKKQ